jgi:hypothetical protein
MESNPAEARVMRAIVARERKRALAERREAKAAAAAAAKPEPSSTSWSTKPDRSRRAGELERVKREAEEAARARWAELHPEQAKAERRLRKERAQLLDRWDHKRNGTPETHERASRRRQGAMARLYQAGGIDRFQLAASDEIRQAAERIGADVALRTMSMETRVDRTFMGDANFFESLRRVWDEMAYTRWRGRARGPIGALLEMIVEDTGVTIAARRYRMSNRTAKALLTDALDLWPKIHGDVRKEVDEGDLIAAHAGLLG